MNNSFIQLFPKKTLFVILFLLVLITILSIIVLLSSKNPPTPTPVRPVIMGSPTPVINISPLQKTVIGQTTSQEIEQKFNILNKQTLNDNKTSYTITSSLINRPDQIITQNNQSIFERLVMVKDQREIIKTSSVFIKFGPADKIFTGSKYYGRQTRTYVYARKGFALIAIANDVKDEMEIYEIQTFPPTSVENYITAYGQDLMLNAPPFQGE